MSRYLVTGAAGFIGAAIARRLVDRGDAVTVVDNLSSGDRANVPPGARFVEGDVADARLWASLDGAGVDAILHLAAQPSAEISHADPLADFDSNARGTFLMLRWAERHGIARVLFASSMAVYGGVEGPVSEDAPLVPASFYGGSKLAAETAIALFGRRGGSTTVLRLFNVYGPGQNLANLRQGMASIYLAYALRAEPIVVKGALDRYRDLVYIDDVVEAWLAALARPQAVGGIYNVGTGQATTVQATVDAVIRAVGGDPRSYPIDQRAGTPGDVHGSVADVSRIARELEWRARVPLDEGIRRMAAWAATASR